MSYGLKYTVPYKTLSDVDCIVNIEVKGYAGDSKELIGGGTPFVISTEENDLYLPMRLSSATLSVYGSDYLQDLYTSDPQGIRVTLLKDFMGKMEVYWVGFMTQDTFSQNFSNPEFIYEIECVSALSTLKYKKFDLEGDFVSFLDIIKRAVVQSNGGYGVINLPSAVQLKDGGNIYEGASIASANFFDELGEAMTYYEILEEIAKYLGCTFTTDRGDVFLLDYLGIKKGFNGYYQAFKDTNGYTLISGVRPVLDTRTVQELGYKGTGATLSRIAGKNKAVVNCSLYEVKNIIPEFGSDAVDSPFSGVQTVTHRKNSKSPQMRMVFKSVGSEKMRFYSAKKNGGSIEYTEHDGLVIGFLDTVGSRYIKSETFNTDNIPNKLNLDDEVMVRNYVSIPDAKNTGLILNQESPILKMVSDDSIIINIKTYFSFSCDIKLNREGQPESSGAPVEGILNSEANGEAGHDFDVQMRLSLKVGSWYYNGSEWVLTPSTFPVTFKIKDGDKPYGAYFSIENKNNYELGIDKLSGYIVNPPQSILSGVVELIVYAPYEPTLFYMSDVTGVRYSYLKNIKLDYQVQDLSSVYSDSDEDNDLIYENAITGDYIDPAEEIDLKICTNPDDKLCLSSVISNGKFLKEIKSLALNKTDIAEHLIIERIIDMFNAPRYQVNPTLSIGARAYSKITDTFLPGTLFVAGSEEDVKMERVTLNLIEL